MYIANDTKGHIRVEQFRLKRYEGIIVADEQWQLKLEEERTDHLRNKTYAVINGIRTRSLLDWAHFSF